MEKGSEQFQGLFTNLSHKEEKLDTQPQRKPVGPNERLKF
jgi:hypothetical protein